VIKDVFTARAIAIMGLVMLTTSAINVNAENLDANKASQYSRINNMECFYLGKMVRGRKAFSVSELDGTFEVALDRINIKHKPVAG